MNIKNLHIPIIIVSVIIALISNYGSFVSAIEPFTFLKMDLNSIERGYINFFSIDSTYNINNEWWRLSYSNAYSFFICSFSF